ncbi:MAG TPA: phosphoribosylglycinamide formyltransferase [Solirubrobacteraceae bacterium]|nr:phosphoribosylglycinamide formyltransferase [Solirubrobacteraceae bacterium]
MSAQLPVAVLVSGTGTNLQALIDTLHGRDIEIVAVASNRPDATALDRARERGIETAAFARDDHADRDARDRALAKWLTERGARLVVLAGYMALLGEEFLQTFPGAVINVHPSLLPAFPGAHAIDDALAYGVKVFGVTVHFVDAGGDTGPVILQQAVELPDARTAEHVLAALRPLEHELLPRAVALFAAGALGVDRQHGRRIVVRSAAGVGDGG